MTVQKNIATIEIDNKEADIMAKALRAYIIKMVGCDCEECKGGDRTLKIELDKAYWLSYTLQKIGGTLYDLTEIDKHLKDWTKFEKKEKTK